jgi:hypothetical protein
MKSFLESKTEIQPYQQEMYNGIVNILKRVKDTENREELVNYVMKDFKKEDIKVEKQQFMKDCGLS